MEFNTDAELFLESVKRRADAAGVSLRQLSEQIGVSSAVLYKWMRKPPMTLAILCKLVEAIEKAEEVANQHWKAESCDGVPGLRLYREGQPTGTYITPEPSSEKPVFVSAQQWAKLQAIWDEPF